MKQPSENYTVLDAPVEAVSTIQPRPFVAPSATASKPEKYIPDAEEVEALAKMLYGEARGIPSAAEKAACVWVVLNRVDDSRFPDSVLDVLEAPYQFAGYSKDYPVLPELEAIAEDVLIRHNAEQNGQADAGRVLPADYFWFTGDGKHNHFRNVFDGSDYWDWGLPSPYGDGCDGE